MNAHDIAVLLGTSEERIGRLVCLGACPVWRSDYPGGKKLWTEADLAIWQDILDSTEPSPLSPAEAASQALIREILDELKIARGE